jgi:hypothetical protein
MWYALLLGYEARVKELRALLAAQHYAADREAKRDRRERRKARHLALLADPDAVASTRLEPLPDDGHTIFAAFVGGLFHGPALAAWHLQTDDRLAEAVRDWIYALPLRRAALARVFDFLDAQFTVSEAQGVAWRTRLAAAYSYANEHLPAPRACGPAGAPMLMGRGDGGDCYRLLVRAATFTGRRTTDGNGS